MELKTTPMMQQYKKIKRGIPSGCILMFRLGDFYEMFFEDAKIASKVLNIALTKRSHQEGRNYPMCGIPYHAAESYIGKLIKAGYKVAVCDQVEDPKLAKGIVRREVTKLITPGTTMDSHLLDEKKNNFLISANKIGKLFGLASLDISTGEFKITEISNEEDFISEFLRISPVECILPNNLKSILEKIKTNGNILANYYDDWVFDYDNSYLLLKEHFKTQSLDGYGCKGLVPGVTAAGAILQYLKENLHSALGHIQKIAPYQVNDFMVLDDATIRNLDIIDSAQGSRKQFTLFNVLDYTVTSMGGRCLQKWIKNPLINIEQIKQRQDAVKYFYENKNIREELTRILKEMPDIERIIGRISSGYANARDLVALKNALKQIPLIKKQISIPDIALLCDINNGLFEFPDLINELDRSLVDDPPLSLREGGFIKTGYDTELDELHKISTDAKGWLANLQVRESERTGIKSLKVRYNKVFGYYIEISKSNLDSAPSDYTRKQTLVNAERFITPELKEYESKILNAKENIGELEYKIFMQIREKINAFTRQIQESAGAIAIMDALISLSIAAIRNKYIFPEVNDKALLQIIGGRHPVVEFCLGEGKRFVPNDTMLDSSENQLMVITGPNMAGKSTYIRQVAILTMMSQIGSGIPAEKAVIGAVDRIFTRVGASDEISKGQSTFMVEMNETAHILNNATPKSLIVLDEIGRGTSTFDGISIAWAVAEYLVRNQKGDSEFLGPKTLFATHYHELIKLAETYPSVKNYNIAVREWNDEIIFLYKILPGSTDKSYGIHVARLAGLPYSILSRAKEIMNGLEQGTFLSQTAKETGQRQMFLFDVPGNQIADMLRSIKIDNLTPIEALNKLKELKEKLDE